MNLSFPVKVLPHRILVTLKDCETLFDSQKADELYTKKKKDFSDTGLRVSLTGPKGELRNIPFFLPLLDRYSQVVITLGDAKYLGVSAPICESPIGVETPGITVTGPEGSVHLPAGVYVPQRRIYVRPKKVHNPHLRDGDLVFAALSVDKKPVPSKGSRIVIFGDVIVRYDTEISQGFYIDEEEAASGNLANGDQVRVLGQSAIPEHRSDKYINRKKRLITENDVRQAIMNNEKIIVESWMMLTPAAKDLGKSHNVLVMQNK